MEYIVKFDINHKNRHQRRAIKAKLGENYGDMEIRSEPMSKEELIWRIKNGTLEHSYCYGGGGGG